MLDPVAEASQRLVELFGLSEQSARRAVLETLDCFRWSVDDYVVARHEQLKTQGLSNEAIYSRVAEELGQLRFRAPQLTARQLRRRIYG
jgi:hypothetical protein